VVSIHKHITELEVAHRLGKLSREGYIAAIRSAAQYAVELDSGITQPFRGRLQNLAAGVEASDSALAESGPRFRAELRDYRDRAKSYIDRLREDLALQAASLQKVYESMASGDGDHERRLGHTLKLLRELAAAREAEKVRAQITKAADSLEESLQELKRQQQVTIAQFLVEIQMLHQRIEKLEFSATNDRVTRLLNREEFEARVASAVAARSEFFLLLLRIRSLPQIKRQLGGAITDELLAAFAKRLRSCIKPDDPAGRWGENEFAILLPG